MTSFQTAARLLVKDGKLVNGQVASPLKWAGGKRWLSGQLKRLYERAGQPRLVDSFAGGFSVAFGLRPKSALLNDINPHSINFFAQARKGFFIDIEMENDKELYYRHRDAFNQLIAAGEHQSARGAAYFYYLNRTGYNGLCRFNKQGQYNVPYGQHKTINYLRDFQPFRDAMKPWKLTHGDFSKIKLSPGDFLYADPPYDVEFTQYAKEDFTWADQVRLAQWLTNHDGPVVASNQATGRMLDLYQDLGFKLSLVDGPRSISRNGDRRPAKEMLATLRT